MNKTISDLKSILKKVETVALVGASANESRDSYKVMKFLIERGYRIFPVNPNEKNILGKECYPSLKLIEEKIDMVNVFRAKKYIQNITKEAIEMGTNVLWLQEGIIDNKAADLCIRSGLEVVMNECPKKVLNAKS